MTRNLFAAIACALLLATYATTSWLAWQSKGITFDEPAHLVAAALQVRQSNFRIDAENPPLWKYYLALVNPAMNLKLDAPPGGDSDAIPVSPSVLDYASTSLYRTPGNIPIELINSGRARMLPLAILLGALIAFWAWRLAGPLAACVACAAYCLDPNFLAHGLLIKNDVAIALFVTALTYALWRVGRAATILNCCAVALLLGTALCTKYSGILGVPLVGIALISRALIPRDWQILRCTARSFAARFLAAVAIGLFALLFSWFFIWACYEFRYQPSRGVVTTDLDRAIQSYAATNTVVRYNVQIDTPPDEFRQDVARWQPDGLIRSIKWIDAHHLFPQSFLVGFIFAASFTKAHAAFLLGQVTLRGWWYYFPLAIAVKTPLATLLALATAAVVSFLLPRPRDPWPICILALPPIIFMASMMHSALDVGIRHLFPIYPFLYIVLGIISARAVVKFRKPAGTVLAILFLGLAVETFAAFPDYIPFFNIAAGGSRGGARLLSDSNIDWGQELPGLAKWQADHTDYQLLLYYFGSGDPRYYGIHYGNLVGSFAPVDQLNPTGQPPCYAVSIVGLQLGPFLNGSGGELFDPLKKRSPAKILGGALYLYAPN
jgi:hypothetical protein